MAKNFNFNAADIPVAFIRECLAIRTASCAAFATFKGCELYNK